MSLVLGGLTLSSLALPGVVQAKESMPSIVVQKAAKQAVIQSMQSQIKKHESMTLNEILADAESQVERNRDYLVRKKVSSETLTQFDEKTFEALSAIRTAGSPEVIVASERAQLQQLMSAEEGFEPCVFAATKSAFSNPVLGILLLPLTVLVDIVFFPLFLEFNCA